MIHVYVAGPYTSDPDANVRRAIGAGQRIRDELGALPFVPHLFHLWDAMIPNDYRFWMEMDFAWLRKCDALLRLPGESSGADEEVALAESLGLPVFHGFDALAAHCRPALSATSTHGPCAMDEGEAVRDNLPPMSPAMRRWVLARLDVGEHKYGTVLRVGWARALEARMEEIADALAYAVAEGDREAACRYAAELDALEVRRST